MSYIPTFGDCFVRYNLDDKGVRIELVFKLTGSCGVRIVGVFEANGLVDVLNRA